MFGVCVRGAFARLFALGGFNRRRGSLWSVVLIGHEYLTAAFYLGRAGPGHYAPIPRFVEGAHPTPHPHDDRSHHGSTRKVHAASRSQQPDLARERNNQHINVTGA